MEFFASGLLIPIEGHLRRSKNDCAEWDLHLHAQIGEEKISQDLQKGTQKEKETGGAWNEERKIHGNVKSKAVFAAYTLEEKKIELSAKKRVGE